ncbi:MAG: replicative DNA helicase [Clostridia bacterium]|nr:replicative DNA helicase [Clostridia bacterium]
MDEGRGALPPQSLEAERSVLGAMLQDSNAVLQAVEALSKEDFYQPAHGEIFDAMRTLFQAHTSIDLITVNQELTNRGTLEGVGGTTYLMELAAYVPATSNAKSYIAIVEEKSTLRKLIRACDEISRDCYGQMNPLPETLARAEKAIFDIVMRRASGESLISIKEVLYNTYNYIEELDKLKGKISGVPTGFQLLDNLLTGLHGGELILIGARPSMGKTSFAISIASHAAFYAGRSVAFFSLEMPREQIVMRMLCADARVDMQHVRQGVMRDEEWSRIARSIGPMSEAKCYLDDTAGITPSQLRSRCRRLMMDRGLDLVVVDYLGLMHSDSKAENRQLEVSEISRQLKAIALELKIPLIACAQLSRAATTRQDKRPVLSDLRDSGSIEQDADVVLFLHREAYYDTQSPDKNVGEVIISKQRNGPLGVVNVAWLEQYAMYANLAQEGPAKGGGKAF